MIRPLFFEFPELSELFDVDEQFMVGSALMVIPVLTSGPVRVSGWVPPGLWYDVIDYKTAPLISEKAQWQEFQADLLTIPVLLRGGHTLLLQEPKLTIRETLAQQYELLVALNTDGLSSGTMYFDDGANSDPGDMVTKLVVETECSKSRCRLAFKGTFGYHLYQKIHKITILWPESVFGDSSGTEFIIESFEKYKVCIHDHVLRVTDVALDLNRPFDVLVSFDRELSGDDHMEL